MASPSIHPTKPNGWVDLRRPGDYPIILGDSLKPNGKSKNSLINVRYNWQPKSGFGTRKGRLTKSGDGYELNVTGPDSDDDDETYQYSGTLNPQSPSGDTSTSSSSLALVFDKSKSAFVLESISTSIDLNLKSGPGHPPTSARSMPQLPTAKETLPEPSQTNGNSKTPTISDDDPGPGDSSNPFDFRHFISEARESLEKSQQQQAGNRTPLSMSGISTPVPPGASRFTSTTPQLRASNTASTPRASTTAAQKRGPGHARTVSATNNTRNAAPTNSTAKRNMPSNSKIKSKERITDSSASDSDNETIAVVRRHQTLPKNQPAKPANTKSTQPSVAATKSHNRNLSANIGSSPHIIINDDDGGLEIDMGSPPPEDKWKNRRNRINPEMFDRSHTGTPVGAAGRSGGAGFAARDRDRDVVMKDVDSRYRDDEDDDQDEDDDVEEFDLGSPRDKRISLPHSGEVSRLDDDDDNDVDEEDEEALLARELEAALDAEDDEDSASAATGAGGIGLGLGISQGRSHQQLDDDDESEVSEEE